MRHGKIAVTVVPVVLVAVVGAGMAGLSCQKSPPPDVAKPATAPVAAAAKPAGKGPIPWMEDDFAGALARAKAEKKPVFVDAWAPWCHTCLSMRSYVFADPTLAAAADRFVWAALDTEKDSSGDFLARYPLEVWPTFFIVDPEDGQVAGRWLGSMSLHQLREFLTDGERNVQLAHAGQLKPDDPLALVRAGDKATVDGKPAEAAKLYAQAVTRAPADWPRRTEALVGEALALRGAKDPGACVDLVLAEMGHAGNGPNAGDFVTFGLDCADELPKGDPRVDKIRHASVDLLLGLVADAKAPLAADDRGDIWRVIGETRAELGDAAGAREASEKRIALLDDAAAHAPDAQAASTYDGARLETLLALGRGPDAVKILTQSEAALPDDYNPPARLARAHYGLKEYGEALAAIDRAIAKAYGPRKGNLLGLKADILDKQGRKDEARKAVEEQIAVYQAAPQKRPAAIAAARKRLEALK